MNSDVFSLLVLILVGIAFIEGVQAAAFRGLGIPLTKKPQKECSGIKESNNARGTNPSIATWFKNAGGFVRVPYTIHYTLSTEARLALELAILQYSRYTCVLLEPKLNSDVDYVEFQDDGTGCWSYLGRRGGKQELNLEQPGCVRTLGTTLHEIEHALGIHHEQSRPDRDQYVTVFLENVLTGSDGQTHTHNFDKESAIDSLGTPYDYLSIMHYSSTAFAKDGTYTILKNDNTVVNTQRNGFSAIDVEQINLLYDCNGVKNTDVEEPTSCYNSNDRGITYRGTVSTATVGSTLYTCDNWTDHVNVEEYHTSDLTSNHCRNPNVMFYNNPICFIYIGGERFYLNCDVDVCPDSTTVKPSSTESISSSTTPTTETTTPPTKFTTTTSTTETTATSRTETTTRPTTETTTTSTKFTTTTSTIETTATQTASQTTETTTPTTTATPTTQSTTTKSKCNGFFACLFGGATSTKYSFSILFIVQAVAIVLSNMN